MWTIASRYLGCASLLSLFAACSNETLEPLDGVGTVQSEPQSARACQLNWKIDNAVSCTVPPTLESPPLVYSTYINAAKQAACDPFTKFPQPVPKASWSTHHVIGETAGEGSICFALKQGDYKNPAASDCVLHEQCFDVKYTTPGKPLELPAIGGWSIADEACARAYYDEGGYVEFRVEGQGLGCSDSGDDVTRLPLCPPKCDDPQAGTDGCENCAGDSSVTGVF